MAKISFIESLVLTFLYCLHWRLMIKLTTHRVPLHWAKSPPLSPADRYSAHSRTWTWLLVPTWGTRGFTSSGLWLFYFPLIFMSASAVAPFAVRKNSDLRGICASTTVQPCQGSARALLRIRVLTQLSVADPKNPAHSIRVKAKAATKAQ